MKYNINEEGKYDLEAVRLALKAEGHEMPKLKSIRPWIKQTMNLETSALFEYHEVFYGLDEGVWVNRTGLCSYLGWISIDLVKALVAAEEEEEEGQFEKHLKEIEKAAGVLASDSGIQVVMKIRAFESTDAGKALKAKQQVETFKLTDDKRKNIKKEKAEEKDFAFPWELKKKEKALATVVEADKLVPMQQKHCGTLIDLEDEDADWWGDNLEGRSINSFVDDFTGLCTVGYYDKMVWTILQTVEDYGIEETQKLFWNDLELCADNDVKDRQGDLMMMNDEETLTVYRGIKWNAKEDKPLNSGSEGLCWTTDVGTAATFASLGMIGSAGEGTTREDDYRVLVREVKKSEIITLFDYEQTVLVMPPAYTA